MIRLNLHIKNIFDEEELDINSTVKEFLTVQKEGNRKVERKVKYYNLDMILSLGYRIKSKVATNFRRWATERLKEYMIKGFTMDDERLKGNGAGAISHDKAIEKAKDEYKKYQVKTISPVEKEYLETLKAISNKIDDKAKSE